MHHEIKNAATSWYENHIQYEVDEQTRENLLTVTLSSTRNASFGLTKNSFNFNVDNTFQLGTLGLKF